MKIKSWQMAVIVIGLLVGVSSALFTVFSGEKVQLTDELRGIDVESGQVYLIKPPASWPMPNPETKKYTIVRLKQDDQGIWHVSGRDMQQLDYIDKDTKVVHVDRNSGDLISPKDPVRYVR